VVIGADLHPGPAGARSVALIPVDYWVNSSTLAEQENGEGQAVDDLTLVLSPRRGYFGFPTGGIVAVSGTIPRQDFARWVRGARKPDRPAVWADLQQVVAARKSANVLIATHLKDLFDPTTVRAALQAFGAVSGDADQVGDRTAATGRFEFGVRMEPFLPAFKRLWPKPLERAGFVVDELKAAEPKAEGKAVVLGADLSDTGQRCVPSVVMRPGDAVSGKDGPTRTPTESAQLAASIQYHKAVNGSLDDLKRRAGPGARTTSSRPRSSTTTPPGSRSCR